MTQNPANHANLIVGTTFGWDSKAVTNTWSWPLTCVRSGPKGTFTPKALGHGSLMTMAPCLLYETIEKSANYNPKSFAWHKPLVLQTQIPATKSHQAYVQELTQIKNPHNPSQRDPYLPCETPCRFFIYRRCYETWFKTTLM